MAESPAASDGFYNEGATVQLTATAANGFTFSGFQGAMTGSANPQSIAMNAPKAVTAGFNTVTVTPPAPAVRGLRDASSFDEDGPTVSYV